MKRYIVSVGGESSVYEFTLSQLQGIYTYSCIDSIYGDVDIQEETRTKEDVSEVPSEAYWSFIIRPLGYTLYGHFERGGPKYIIGTLTKPEGLSIRVSKTPVRYYPIITSNLPEFLSGFLFTDLIARGGKSSQYSFQVVSSQEPGFVPLITLLGFRFLDLPPELQQIITSYYPCDWVRVNKSLNALVREWTLADQSIPTNIARLRIHKLLQHKLSTSEITKVANYLRSDTSNDPERLRFVKSVTTYLYPEIIDATIEGLRKERDTKPVRQTSVLPTIGEQQYNDLISGKFRIGTSLADALNMINLGNVHVINYLLNDRRYSDILYFDVLDKYDYPLESSTVPLTIQNLRIFLPTADNIGNLSNNSLVEYVEDLFQRNGVYYKGQTNPKTGTTRKDYIPINYVVDINKFVSDLIELAKYRTYNQAFRVIANHIVAITDPEVLSKLIEELRRGPLLADLYLATQVYQYALGGNVLSQEVKDGIRRDIAHDGSKLGYSQEFINELQAIH